MFTLAQLEFITQSLTLEGTAVPANKNGETARLFVSILDEIERQKETLKAFAANDKKA